MSNKSEFYDFTRQNGRAPQKNGIQFWGNSFVAGPQGEILAQASNMDEENMVVELDMTRSENVRRWWPFLRDRRIDKFENLTRRFID